MQDVPCGPCPSQFITILSSLLSAQPVFLFFLVQHTSQHLAHNLRHINQQLSSDELPKLSEQHKAFKVKLMFCAKVRTEAQLTLWVLSPSFPPAKSSIKYMTQNACLCTLFSVAKEI